MRNRKNSDNMCEKINEEDKWDETELKVYWDEELLAEDWLSKEDSVWNDL